MPQPRKKKSNGDSPVDVINGEQQKLTIEEARNPEFVLKQIADLTERSNAIDTELGEINERQRKLSGEQAKIRAALSALTAK